MQKDTKCVNSHPARDGLVARAINVSGSDDHVRNSKSFCIFFDDFVLLDFSEAVRFPSEFGASLNGARLIQHPPPRFPNISIYGERADVDKALEAFVMQACFEKIPRGHN